MSYSVIGILAILIHFIVNEDVLLRKEDAIPAQKAYRRFLLGVLTYYITDVLWGILDETHLTTLLFIDTTAYFLVMIVAILLWMQYVVIYLGKKNTLSTILSVAGRAFFTLEIAALIVNCFTPIMFRFDETGAYHAGVARYITLAAQIVLFLLTSAYTLTVMKRAEGAMKRRHIAIGAFGVAMITLILIQVFYPLLPLYSMGYLLGCCLLHTFVVEDEKSEYRKELEAALKREQQQKKALGSAQRMAYTDSLTQVKNKHAYVEKEMEMDHRIAEHAVEAFGVMVFDLNGLKQINDTRGHEVGDQYIVSACKLICVHFSHSPVYRIGGDEFVAILEGNDYEARETLKSAFDQQVTENLRNGRAVVASGLAVFLPDSDNSYHTVFNRADKEMYQRKRLLKQAKAG